VHDAVDRRAAEDLAAGQRLLDGGRVRDRALDERHAVRHELAVPAGEVVEHDDVAPRFPEHPDHV